MVVLGGVVTWQGLALAAGPAAAAAPVAAKKDTPKSSFGVLKLDGVPDSSVVQAYSWGVSNSGSTHTGGGGGAGRVNVQDLSLSKGIDDASVPLLRNALTGRHTANGSLTICDPTDCANTTTFVYTLQDVLVTSVSQGGGVGGGPQVENVTLNFAKVTVTLGASTVSFDAAANTVG